MNSWHGPRFLPDNAPASKRLLEELPGEPSPAADKYSEGVVAICAGSEMFPGAGILTTGGAVRATSSMVRFIGREPGPIIQAYPEVVWHPDVASAGRWQACVVGPGRGTDRATSEELGSLLGTDLPLIIDADALTLIAQSSEHMDALIRRSAPSLLTPHTGEFDRLARAIGERTGSRGPGQLGKCREEHAAAAQWLARELNCTVLLKGRLTTIADSQRAVVVDAGSSWAASPGSGDVLSGIVGALVAREEAARAGAGGVEADPGAAPMNVVDTAALAVMVHAVASYLSAQTRFGPAPTSASRIVEHIPEAIAWLRSRQETPEI